MGKYDFISTANIVPLPKKLVYKYQEGYDGEEKEITFNIYPYTVKEKLEMQEKNKLIKQFMDSNTEDDSKQATKLLEELGYTSAYYVLKKEDKDITMDIIKKLPLDLIDEIAFKALEFEGITKESIKEHTKKELGKV